MKKILLLVTLFSPMFAQAAATDFTCKVSVAGVAPWKTLFEKTVPAGETLTGKFHAYGTKSYTFTANSNSHFEPMTNLTLDSITLRVNVGLDQTAYDFAAGDSLSPSGEASAIARTQFIDHSTGKEVLYSVVCDITRQKNNIR